MSDIRGDGGVGNTVHSNASMRGVSNGIPTDGCALDIARVQELN